MKIARSRYVLCATLVFIALLPSGAGCGGERDIEFPYTLRIAPGNVLFVHGHEFHDSVTCTWEPGDTLRIGGVPVLRARQPQRTKLSNARLESLYSQVPYVVGLVRDGHSWQDAADAYNARREEHARSLVGVYLDALETTGSDSLAAAAAVDSMDWTLIDASVEPTIGPQSIGLVWKGLRYWFVIEFADKTPTNSALILAEGVGKSGDASDLVRSLSRDIGTESRTPRLEIITTGRALLTGSSARDALRQISEAEKGNLIDGPLREWQLKQILAVKEGVQ